MSTCPWTNGMKLHGEKTLLFPLYNQTPPWLKRWGVFPPLHVRAEAPVPSSNEGPCQGPQRLGFTLHLPAERIIPKSVYTLLWH